MPRKKSREYNAVQNPVSVETMKFKFTQHSLKTGKKAS